MRLTYNPLPMKRYSRPTLLLVACLLLGQLAQMVHAYDFASHDDGGTCDICLSSQARDHASACPNYGLPKLLTDERPLVVVLAQQDLSTHFHYLSRAPPQ